MPFLHSNTVFVNVISNSLRKVTDEFVSWHNMKIDFFKLPEEWKYGRDDIVVQLRFFNDVEFKDVVRDERYISDNWGDNSVPKVISDITGKFITFPKTSFITSLPLRVVETWIENTIVNITIVGLPYSVVPNQQLAEYSRLPTFDGNVALLKCRL